MIQAQDLRFGNLVTIKNVEGYQIVTGTDSKPMKDGMYYQIKAGDQWYIPAHVSPVELTPEILEKCGFKYFRHDGLSSFEEARHDPDDFTYEWELSFKTNEILQSSFSMSMIKWGNDKHFTFSNNRLRIIVKHVHQLQNLIFALSGTELNITPLIKEYE